MRCIVILRFILLASVLTLWAATIVTCRVRDSKSQFMGVARQPGMYKGIAAIELLLKEKLIHPTSKRDFRLLLALGLSPSDNLANMLAQYDGLGANNAIVNPWPNPVTTTIWKIVMTKNASMLASSCDKQPKRIEVFDRYDFSSRSLNFHPHVESAMEVLCGTVSENVNLEGELKKIWTSLVDYSVPVEVFEEWRDYLVARHKVTGFGSVFVEEVYSSLFLSPYFLLVY